MVAVEEVIVEGGGHGDVGGVRGVGYLLTWAKILRQERTGWRRPSVFWQSTRIFVDINIFCFTFFSSKEIEESGFCCAKF
ncbi:hypothetical protein QYF36_025354 [Acer negundo]|nr:hypothetical protein QYF36_025354 [Acer negundo]